MILRRGDLVTVAAKGHYTGKPRARPGWRARFGLDETSRDSWRWQSQNPEGFPA
jgi:UDP-glucose 4-epimerase